MLDFYADGTTPVSEQLAFTGTQEPASPPYGLRVRRQHPGDPTVPGGPDASILSLNSTIGAPNVAYYVTKRVRTVDTERVDGHARKVTAHGHPAGAAARQGPGRAEELPGRRIPVRAGVHLRRRQHGDGAGDDPLPVGRGPGLGPETTTGTASVGGRPRRSCGVAPTAEGGTPDVKRGSDYWQAA